ncbi:ROK family transcriptional regulator [Nonomuraea gerenzanensis]|uniref:Predicted N-acetyl-glucosamine kinase 2, ROK family n=1 Tax=Nonomuraea gerenzanensis TaxID=93944 RepID=A0A1M4EAJ2_9ACTN|nr:ROK family transcriptional regulator [Nonomuraea gerenzanensis]UBU17971.1 ROK family transcriptional regulator [Nonomuraea gerenzanensis]SBO95772.1 Predicted N-acetyl-glucosamine kinase 2, ROK family [Nonomuraea gerenzanensis]
MPTPVQDVRRLHRRLVLRTLRDHGPQPRAGLARRLGLSPTTMTKVVAQLLDEGLVSEGATDGPGTRVGRPSTGIRLRPDARQVIGVQVGAGTVRLGLCDLKARARDVRSFGFDVAGEPPERVVARIAEAAGVLAEQAGDRLLGIGVAAPGPVDPGQRRNVLSVNLGWRDVAFSDPLERALGVPAVVDHNVRAMALAEARYGDTGGADPLLYVYVRTGVGAGLVIGGQPFRTGTHGVTELGHLRVAEHGRPCACGATGCLETVAAEPYLAEQARVLLARDSADPLADLAAAAEGGDGRAVAVLDEVVDRLATGLASAVNLLNPALIMLGGAFRTAPEPVFDQLRQALRARAFPVLRDAVQVRRATLGPDAGVVGSAAVALDRLFYDV